MFNLFANNNVDGVVAYFLVPFLTDIFRLTPKNNLGKTSVSLIYVSNHVTIIYICIQLLAKSQNWHRMEKIDLLPSIECGMRRSERKMSVYRKRKRSHRLKAHRLTFDIMYLHEYSIFAHSAEYIKFGCYVVWCLPFNFHRIVWYVVVLGVWECVCVCNRAALRAKC